MYSLWYFFSPLLSGRVCDSENYRYTYISQARRSVFEIVSSTFACVKTRSENALKDFQSRPAATNVKVLGWLA